MLVFSLPKCSPCSRLNDIFTELFTYASEQSISLPLQVIKFNYDDLSHSDKEFFEVFPTTIVISPDELQKIDDNEPLVNYGINNCSVYKGQLNKLCDDHHLVLF
jgi:hypothetical protein